MKTVQEYRDKAAEAEAVVADQHRSESERAAYRILARNWWHCANYAEWLADRRSRETVRRAAPNNSQKPPYGLALDSLHVAAGPKHSRIHGGGTLMSVQIKEFCSSSNGDRWFLARDKDTARVFVRHQANTSSGGHITDFRIGTFLEDEHKPEHQELLRVIGEAISGQPDQRWRPPDAAPAGVSILVCGLFGIVIAQLDHGEFWAMAGDEEAYTETGGLLMLEGVTGWMTLPEPT